jgi:hypothetical protein
MLKILNDKRNQMVLIIVLLVIILSIFTKGFTQLKPMSKDAIAQKGIEFIKEQVAKQNPNAKITLDKTEAYHGIVKATITIDTEKVELFITNDGKVGFIQPIVMDKEEAIKKYTKTDKVDVKLFTMSYCPFGNDAENVMIPVEILLRNDVTIEPHYVIYSNYPTKEEQKDYC